MKRKILGLTIFSIVCPFILFGQQNVGIDDLFREDDVIVENTNVQSSFITNIEKEAVSLSGSFRFRGLYNFNKEFIKGSTNWSVNSVSADMEANVLFDIRLKSGLKAFASLYADYSPIGKEDTHYYTSYQTTPSNIITNTAPYVETNNTTFSIKEIFMDMNINRVVYFRVGKQVLQWGRCYFWNPTDLLNIEKRQFSDLNAYREGTFALKTHIPFGTFFNIYGVINANDIKNINESAVAAKAECLLGTTEISFSTWAKKDFFPVFGFDFISFIFDTTIRGEISVSYGDNKSYLKTDILTNGIIQTNFSTTRITNEWIPRISVGFTKRFDFLDVDDRISISGEFFYNPYGYKENILKEEDQRLFLLANNLFELNYNYQYYFAFFTSFSKFIVSEITLSVNAIGNFNDNSWQITGGITYEPVDYFTFEFNLSSCIGEDNSEYTFQGNSLSVESIFTMKF